VRREQLLEDAVGDAAVQVARVQHLNHQLVLQRVKAGRPAAAEAAGGAITPSGVAGKASGRMRRATSRRRRSARPNEHSIAVEGRRTSGKGLFSQKRKKVCFSLGARGDAGRSLEC
jgi:hypothetical protein